LAVVDLDLELPRSQEVEVIIPAKAVNELQRLLRDSEDPIKIRVGDNQIAFELNMTLLVSKLIDGNYPNYKQVIPAETRERVTLEREAFLNSVRRVALLASEKSNSVKLIFTKNNLEIANEPQPAQKRSCDQTHPKALTRNPRWVLHSLVHGQPPQRYAPRPRVCYW
jgi:DNA polymerase-3 subunit beta